MSSDIEFAIKAALLLALRDLLLVVVNVIWIAFLLAMLPRLIWWLLFG